MLEKVRVLNMVTSPFTFRVMRGQLRYVNESGFDVTVVSSPGEQLDDLVRTEGVEVRSVSIEREISLFKDIVSLVRLITVMRSCAPDITNVSTPKAGLLGTLAAMLLGVPCRIYTLRGLRCETAKGVKRRILQATEYLVCRLSHRVICAGPSLRQRAIDLGIVRPERAIILSHGSTNGVNVSEFEPTLARRQAAVRLRKQLGIAATDRVVGSVARLTRDKGVPELYEVFLRLRKKFSGLRLMLVGDFERGDPISPELRSSIESDPDVICTGFVKDPAPYFHLMDLFALPTHREGFPNVVLEAQAACVPVVTTTATGAVDSIVNGSTGFLVPVGDACALEDAIGRLLDDDELRHRMGCAGQEWVAANFSTEVVWEALLREYRELLRGSHATLALPEQSQPES